MHAGNMFVHSHQAVVTDLQASGVWFGINAEEAGIF
jgi:hypothetical protein